MTPPSGYLPLEGSERRPSPSATLVGPADPSQEFQVTIVVRRRIDGPPLPDFDYFENTLPAGRQRLSQDEFAASYGSSPDDMEKVIAFVSSQNLSVIETHAARRTVVASGTVAQMEAAFALQLGVYEHKICRRRGEEPVLESYRGRDGFIYLPERLIPIVTNVSGLDNRTVMRRGQMMQAASPFDAGQCNLTVTELARHYNFPTNSATTETIAVLGAGNYLESDIVDSFIEARKENSALENPTVTRISIDKFIFDPTPDGEVNMDINICAMAAPGASVVLYGAKPTAHNFANAIRRVVHPEDGDRVCSVLSCSWGIYPADDEDYLQKTRGVSESTLVELSMAFRDAAIQGVTICFASGDYGARSFDPDDHKNDGVGTDLKAHLGYPSEPWILLVGGTRISGDPKDLSSLVELAWNDNDTDEGASAGGISRMFELPDYQRPRLNFHVPPHVNDNTYLGRGVPDVAACASNHSGVGPIVYNGQRPSFGSGTSAAAPLWAGFIAVLNAALGYKVGFINPLLYAAGVAGKAICTDIVAGWDSTNDNSYNNFANPPQLIPGYPVNNGWDCCTGWGVPNGIVMLNYFRGRKIKIYMRDTPDDSGDLPTTEGLFYESPDIIVCQDPVSNPQLSFGPGSGTEKGFPNEAVIRNHDQSIYVRVLNSGIVDAKDVLVTVYYCDPSLFTNPTLWKQIGTTTLKTVPKGDVLTVSNVITWKQADIPAPGHYCFIAVAADENGHLPISFENMPAFTDFIKTQPQVVMHNVAVTKAPDPQSVAHLAAAQPQAAAVAVEKSAPPPAPLMTDDGFRRFPIHVTGAHDAARTFSIRTYGTLPKDGSSQVVFRATKSFAENFQFPSTTLSPDAKEKGLVIAQLPPSGDYVLGTGSLEQNSIHLCEFRAKIAPDVFESDELTEFRIMQFWEDKEIGRFTWRFGRRQTAQG